jgi:TRAP-type C4-dicarboxylate transport system permease small subunit
VPLLYWPGVAIFAALCIMGVSLAIRAMELGESALGQPMDWGQRAAILALVVMFLWLIWQMGSFFKRNMPRRYTLDAVPADLLPKAPKEPTPEAR